MNTIELNDDILEMLKDVNPLVLGYGEPGNCTKMLANEGLISLSIDEKTTLWYAALTEEGKEIIKTKEG